jgi:hypothetical protein
MKLLLRNVKNLNGMTFMPIFTNIDQLVSIILVTGSETEKRRACGQQVSEEGRAISSILHIPDNLGSCESVI